jgi:hypothetical protein
VRKRRADAGIEIPESRFWSRLLYSLLMGSVLALFGFAFALATVLPDGVPWEGPRLYKGLLSVPGEGVTRASWVSEHTLRKEAAGEVGWSFGSRYCVDVPPAVEQALRGVDRIRLEASRSGSKRSLKRDWEYSPACGTLPGDGAIKSVSLCASAVSSR